jgi:hypothetical protein
MPNQYVNLTPQQRMAQMLQQQSQPTQLQGQQAMPQTMGASNPFGGMSDSMKMYNQYKQSADLQDYKDYMNRLKLGQAQIGGMFDSANSQAPMVNANNYTG